MGPQRVRYDESLIPLGAHYQPVASARVSRSDGLSERNCGSGGKTTAAGFNLACMSLDKGLRVLKFFPTEALGGVRMLKAIATPYGRVGFIPTGGINQNNLADYPAHPSVHCFGGSWLVKANLITAGGFDEITQLTRDASVRGACGARMVED